MLSRGTEVAICASRENSIDRNYPSFDSCLQHFSRPCLSCHWNPIRSSTRLRCWQG